MGHGKMVFISATLCFLLVAAAYLLGLNAIPTFDATVYNCTSEDIGNTELRLGEFVFRSGKISPQGASSRLGIRSRVPAVAFLSWRSAKTDQVEVAIPLQRDLPSDFRDDEIVFQIWGSTDIRLCTRPSVGTSSEAKARQLYSHKDSRRLCSCG